MRFHTAQGTTEITVGGQTYPVDGEGFIYCDNHEHHQLLRQLGCKGEGDEPPVVPVEAAEPPAIPEGMVSEEAVRALIEENEDQKVAIEKLNGDVEAMRERISELSGQLETATNALSAATEGAGVTEGGENTPGKGKATEEAPPADGKAKAK